MLRLKGWVAGGIALGLFVGGASTLGVALLTENEAALSKAPVFDAPTAIAQVADASDRQAAAAAVEQASPEPATIQPTAAPATAAAVPASASPIEAVAPAAAKADAITQADPRWARDVRPTVRTFADLAEDAPDPMERAFASREPTRGPAAPAIFQEDEVTRPATDTPASAEIAPEEETADEQKTAAIPPVTEPEPEEPAATTNAPVTGTARIKSGVNMRAAGRKGARVIGTVPASSTVQLVSCDAWCEVVHNGRRGFVYNTFVEKTVAQPAAAAKPAKPNPGKAEAAKAVSKILNDSGNRGR